MLNGFCHVQQWQLSNIRLQCLSLPAVSRPHSLALRALMWVWLPLQQVPGQTQPSLLQCAAHTASACMGAGDKKMAKVYNTDPYRDCFAVTVPKEVGTVHSLQCRPAGSWHANLAAAPALPAGDA